MSHQVVYHHNSGGRSGHILKDLTTCFTYAELHGLQVAYSRDWEKQNIIPCRRISKKLPAICNSRAVVIAPPEQEAWGGMSFEEYLRVAENIEKAKEGPSKALVVFSGVTRVHLFQLYQWERERKLSTDGNAFKRVIHRMRDLYWGSRFQEACQSTNVKNVVIHARRGDVALPKSRHFCTRGSGLWSLDAYKEIIFRVKSRYPEALITVLTELANSEDLEPLASVNGVFLERNRSRKLRSDFARMVEADLFIPCNSSVSYWAALLTPNLVYCAHGGNTIKHLPYTAPFSNFINL